MQEQLSDQQMLNKRAVLSAVLSTAVVGSMVLFAMYALTMSHENQLAPICVIETQVSPLVKAGNGLTTAKITLDDVPRGMRVPMRAQWLSPDGHVYHVNRWATKPAETPGWETYARCGITSGAEVGTWQVRFYVGDRLVATKKFTVEN